MKALVHMYSQGCPDGFSFPTQHIQDILRLMRSRLQDSSLASEFMNLLVNLLVRSPIHHGKSGPLTPSKSRECTQKNQAIRQECIESGVLQYSARSIFVHRWGGHESNRTVLAIVSSICSEADVRRYLCVLETHVNLSAQLSPTDLVSPSFVSLWKRGVVLSLLTSFL